MFRKLGEDPHGTLAVLILLAATAFVVFKMMTSEQWVDLAKWVAGIFSGTHAALSISSDRKPTVPAAIVVEKS